MTMTPEEMYAKIKEVNARLLAGEPGNITTNKNGERVETGYDAQAIIDTMNDVLMGHWGYKELSNELKEGKASYYAVSQVEFWLEGIEFRPTAWSLGRNPGDEGDARKSGQTGAMKKAASQHSIGNRAYLGLLEGLVAPPEKTAAERAAEIRAAKEQKEREKKNPTATPLPAKLTKIVASPAPVLHNVPPPVAASVPAPQVQVQVQEEEQEEQPLTAEELKEEQDIDALDTIFKSLTALQKSWLKESIFRANKTMPQDIGQAIEQGHITTLLTHAKQWIGRTSIKQQQDLPKYIEVLGQLAVDRLSMRLFRQAPGLLSYGLTDKLILTLYEALFPVNLALQVDPQLEMLSALYPGCKSALDLIYNPDFTNDAPEMYLTSLIAKAKENPLALSQAFQSKYAKSLHRYQIVLSSQGNDADPSSVASSRV